MPHERWGAACWCRRGGVIDKMYGKGVSSVLDYSVEGKESEEQFDRALNKTLEIINFAEQKVAMPIAVFKPTGFGRIYLYKKIQISKIKSID